MSAGIPLSGERDLLIAANPDLDYDARRRVLPVEGLFEALLFQNVGQKIPAENSLG